MCVWHNVMCCVQFPGSAAPACLSPGLILGFSGLLSPLFTSLHSVLLSTSLNSHPSHFSPSPHLTSPPPLSSLCTYLSGCHTHFRRLFAIRHQFFSWAKFPIYYYHFVLGNEYYIVSFVQKNVRCQKKFPIWKWSNGTQYATHAQCTGKAFMFSFFHIMNLVPAAKTERKTALGSREKERTNKRTNQQ